MPALLEAVEAVALLRRMLSIAGWPEIRLGLRVCLTLLRLKLRFGIDELAVPMIRFEEKRPVRSLGVR